MRGSRPRARGAGGRGQPQPITGLHGVGRGTSQPITANSAAAPAALKNFQLPSITTVGFEASHSYTPAPQAKQNFRPSPTHRLGPNRLAPLSPHKATNRTPSVPTRPPQPANSAHHTTIKPAVIPSISPSEGLLGNQSSETHDDATVTMATTVGRARSAGQPETSGDGVGSSHHNHDKPLTGSDKNASDSASAETSLGSAELEKADSASITADSAGQVTGSGNGDCDKSPSGSADQNTQSTVKGKGHSRSTKHGSGTKGMRSAPKSAVKGDKKSRAPAVRLSASERLLAGHLDNLPPPASSVVRVFLSSTFSDFRAERNALVTRAYPTLTSLCRDLHLDFEVVDLRWGISAGATNDHKVEPLCLGELRQCQRLSRGTNFVTLLGDRYGYRPLPASLPREEFVLLRRLAGEQCLPGTVTMDTWYLRDDNADPPVYLLQTVDSLLPAFTSSDPAQKAAAAARWGEVYQTLTGTLREAATLARKQGAMTAQREREFYASVTEQEVAAGVLDHGEASGRVVVFCRHVSDYDLSDPDTRRYTDVLVEDGAQVPDSAVLDLRQSLQARLVPPTVPAHDVHDFHVHWAPGGIHPDTHKDYLTDLCDKFVSSISKQITDYADRVKKEEMDEMTKPTQVTKQVKPNTQQMNTTNFLQAKIALDQMVHDYAAADDTSIESTWLTDLMNQLREEILHHLHICKAKSEIFCGRKSELATIKQSLESSQSGSLVVVHGKPGTGKTAFAAAVCRKARGWLGPGCVVVGRFLGTSVSSSTLKKTLSSICCQICAVYKFAPKHRMLSTLDRILGYLAELLLHVSVLHGKLRPLVIVLDAVEQLSSVGGSQELAWVPTNLPKGIHVLLSIKSNTDALKNAQKVLCNKKATFMELSESVDNETVQDFIDSYVSAEKRKITKDQQKFLLNHSLSNPHPLLLKLNLDTACRWTSFQKTDRLPSDIQAAIDLLLDQFESKFGRTLVAASLSYITISSGGISKNELEDALSCSDEVLDEVYQFHNPPVTGVVRIPPLLWARIRYDLGDHLVERHIHGKTVLFWNHLQFAFAVERRYLKDETLQSRHAVLADIFSADGQFKRTIVLSRRKLTVEDADRQISLQPLDLSNKRRLTAHPFHLENSHNYIALRESCFCNLQYILTFMEAFSLGELLTNISDYLASKGDTEVRAVYESLRYNGSVIQGDAGTLCVQLLGSLLGRDAGNLSIRTLSNDAKSWLASKSPTLVPGLGSFPSSSGMLKWYIDGPNHIDGLTDDKGALLVREETSSKVQYGVLNTDTLEICNTAQIKEDVIQAHLTSNKKVFLLTTKLVRIFSGDTGKCLCNIPTDVRSGGHLNQRMVVSADERHLVLGGAERLAMLERTTKPGGQRDYVVKAVMNLSGAVVTTNLMFNHDSSMTISSHSIKGKNGKLFGALVLWSFTEKQLKVKLALPGICYFLYPLQPLSSDDLFVCGCDGGQLLLVDMFSGKIVSQSQHKLPMPNKRADVLSTLDSNSSILLVATRGAKSLHIVKVSKDLIAQPSTLNNDTGISALCLGNNGKNIIVGAVTGGVTVYAVDQSGQPARMRVLQAVQDSAVTGLVCDSLAQTFASGDEGTLRLLDLDHDPESEEDAEAEVVGGLEHEELTSFSVTGSAIFTGSSCGLKMWTSSGESFELKTTLSEVNCIKTCSTNDIVVASFNNNEFNKLMIFNEQGTLINDDFEVPENIIDFHIFQTVLVVISESKTITCIDLLKETKAKSIGAEMDLTSASPVELLGQQLVVSKPQAGYELSLHSINLDTGASLTCEAEGSMTSVSFVARYDSVRLLLGLPGAVMTWDPSSSPHPVLTSIVPGAPLTAMSVSGHIVVTAGGDGSLVMWETGDDRLGGDVSSVPLTGHRSQVTSLALSPDGRYLASASRDHTVALHDVAAKRRASVAHVHTTVRHLGFSLDGRLLYGRGADDGRRRMFVFNVVTAN